MRIRLFAFASVVTVSACSTSETSYTPQVSRGSPAQETVIETRAVPTTSELPSTDVAQNTAPRSSGNQNLPTKPALLECTESAHISSGEGREEVNQAIDEMWQELVCALNDLHNDIHQTSYDNYVESLERYAQSEKDRLEDQSRLSECERTGIPDYSGWIDPPEPVEDGEDPCIWLSLHISASEYDSPPGPFDDHQAKPLTSFASFVQKWSQLEALADTYPDSFSPESLSVIVSQGDNWRKCLSDQVICVNFHD